MKRLFLTLCMHSVLVFNNAAPYNEESAKKTEGAQPQDRCAGVEFDAIAPDEQGNSFFFKGAYAWKGFSDPAQPSNVFFKELGDLVNLPGHPQVQAAFRMHSTDKPQDHDHIYLFQDDTVFSYFNQTLEEGYPMVIQQVFPGIPDHLDAAVECPKGECAADSVIFFKGSEVHHYDIATRTVKTKSWPHLPRCTSAYRWLENYYCFHGNNFTKFHPVSGEVTGTYPKDARRYFMKCPNFGHGGGYSIPKCSEVTLDAITSDDAGKAYFFKGPVHMRLDTSRDGRHAFPIFRTWKELARGVDAVFSFADKMYFIKGDQVYIYRSGAHYTLIDGYPKTLKEELGIEGQVDAAFACAGTTTAHLIQGHKMVDVDLEATPRAVVSEALLPFPHVDAAMCGPEGLRLFVGSQYYEYETPALLQSRIYVRPQNITSAMMGCQD